MNPRPPSSSPLERALSKIKKSEEGLWGRVQGWNHRWLSRLEGHPTLRNYLGILRRPQDATIPSPGPAIDLDSLFPLSLFLHLLLILILMQVSFPPQPVAQKPQPILVRLLDLGQPASLGVEEPKKEPPRKIRTQPKASPSPAAEPKPAAAPETKPVPVLPAPKVLAEAPREKFAPAARETAESLVQLPRQSESGQGSAAAKAEALPGAATDTGSIPQGLRQGEMLQRPGLGGSSGASALSSPDFGPYLETIKKRVQSVWQYPDGLSGKHQINLVFVLDRTGGLIRVEVLDSSDPKLNSTALQAVRRASPFPPIPESLRDLAGSPLRIRFNIDFGLKAKR